MSWECRKFSNIGLLCVEYIPLIFMVSTLYTKGMRREINEAGGHTGTGNIKIKYLQVGGVKWNAR
jgi:hypothetical protein